MCLMGGGGAAEDEVTEAFRQSHDDQAERCPAFPQGPAFAPKMHTALTDRCGDVVSWHEQSGHIDTRLWDQALGQVTCAQGQGGGRGASGAALDEQWL